MNMRPTARMDDQLDWTWVLSASLTVVVVASIVVLAAYDHWNWAWLLLGLLGVGYLGDIHTALKKIS